MLNWIAYWVGSYLLSIGGPLQSDTQASVPISNDIQDSAKLHVLWGGVQGLHVGFFLAIAALVAFWVIIDRTTLGFGMRAVGANPEAARYGGINVARNYFLAMAISGVFAGLAGAVDLLGGSTDTARSTSSSPTSASSASLSPCSGGTRPSASSSPRSSSARC